MVSCIARRMDGAGSSVQPEEELPVPESIPAVDAGAAALKIQSAWRVHQARRETAARLEAYLDNADREYRLQTTSSVRLQAAARGMLVRRAAQQLL